MIKRLLILLFFFIPVLAFADFGSNKLNIETEDGTVSTYPYKLKFPNTSLTDNGDDTTSVTFSGSGGAPTDATYITQTANGDLSAEQALGALATGILKSTTTTGVLSIAEAGDFPTLNQSTTGSAASLSISGQSGLLTFTGIAGTNRQKTIRDAADTLLELGGSYTPTGTWSWATASVTWPTFNQNTSGTAANLSGTPALPNGTTATTQSQGDNSTKLTTTAYVDTGLGTKQATVGDTTDLIVQSLTVGRNGAAGAEGIITLRDGANPGATKTLSYTKWADLEGVNGIIKSNGSGDYSAASAGTDYISPYGSTTAKYFLAAPNASDGTPSFRAIVASDIPTLNQNTSGSAATLTTARTIGGTSFNGSANIAIGALNSTNVGATTSAELYGVISDETGAGSGSPLAVFNQNPTINGATLTGAIDAGGASSFEIPNGTLGTTDATGEIYLDTNGDGGTNFSGPAIQVYTGAANAYLFPIALPLAASQDNYIMKYDAGTKTVGWEADAGGGASTALDNLASVAINTSLLSDSDNTDDLGSTTKTWANTYTTNLIVNDGSVGTSGVGVAVFKNGTVPSSSPADEVQLYAQGIADAIKFNNETADTTTPIGDAGGDDYWMAIKVVTDRTITITALSISLGADVGTPSGNMTVTLETDSSGPSGSLVNANATVAFARTASAWNKQSVTNFSLTAGTYWLVAKLPAQTTDNRAQWNGKTTGTTNGRAYSVNGGSSWNLDNWNLDYRLYGLSSELRARDEAGNVTTLSPHNFKNIPQEVVISNEKESSNLAWAYHSERSGKEITVDMFNAIRDLEAITGKKYIYTNGAKIEDSRLQKDIKTKKKEAEDKDKLILDLQKRVEQLEKK